jgi:uncharacterized membrane protein YadS
MRDWYKTEDWWAVWIGFLIFVLALAGLQGTHLLGWGLSTSVWTDLGKAMAPVAATHYPGLPGWGSLLCTYAFLVTVLSVGAAIMGWNVRRFAISFTVIFLVSYVCVLIGHFAYIAATPNEHRKFAIAWSLGLTGEAGYILALLAGLVLGNFFPQAAHILKEGARSEWFIKTAVVIMGIGLGVKAASQTTLAGNIIFRGFAAIIEAYLIYWALVYFIARKFFKFSREWAAPLASGISICGVSAAIATGAAIRARPVVPVMVSSLVVVFAVIELLLLPFLAQYFLYTDPLVAAAWMGLAVKTDGAAIASGTITEAWIYARLAVEYKEGWMLMTTTTVKMFIDVFIGVWSFLLALIWVYRIDRREGETVRVVEIWQRFPKFVLGYAATFAVALTIALNSPSLRPALEQVRKEADVFRTLFFAMTFFTIGMAANFKKLWAEGIGRLALVYVVCLFGFVIWLGLGISWLFFHGVLPPIATPTVP